MPLSRNEIPYVNGKLFEEMLPLAFFTVAMRESGQRLVDIQQPVTVDLHQFYGIEEFPAQIAQSSSFAPRMPEFEAD
jgi:hypothetical protein